MNDKNLYQNLLAEARAIHLIMHHGLISFEEAKAKTRPMLKTINQQVVQIAAKYNQRPKLLKFQDLGRSL